MPKLAILTIALALGAAQLGASAFAGQYGSASGLAPCSQAGQEPREEDHTIPDGVGAVDLPGKTTYLYLDDDEGDEKEKEGFWEESNPRAGLQTEDCVSTIGGQRIVHYVKDTFRGWLVA